MTVPGIQHISYALGRDSIDVGELRVAQSVAPDFISLKTGFTSLRKKTASEQTTDLAYQALQKLLVESELSPDKISCLVVVTQTPDNFGVPHVSARVHGLAKLPKSCASFDISLGCSGFVQGLSIVAAFLDANHLDNGVLITADPYSKIVSPDDKDTALLFGDAAAATLLSRNGLWTAGNWHFGTDGSRGDHIRTDCDGRLHMNGRQVFNFCATEIPRCIEQTLAENGKSIDEVDKMILHQGSRYMVETIAERAGFTKEVFFAADYGNTVSSSIPIAFQDNVTTDDETVLICGFGVGLSWASTILSRRED